MKRTQLFSLLSAMSIACVSTAWAELNNEQVIQMHAQGIGEETIILAIENSETSFETDADSIIEMSKKGIPSSIINAMVKAGSAGDQKEAKKEDFLNPESVLIEDGEESVALSYQIPSNRTKARGLGFGGVVTYSVLKGTAAKYRTSDKSPTFIVSVPENAAPESYVSLASLEPRKNNSREVVIGGGYMSYSTGIIPDRLRETKIEKLDDQSRAAEKFVLYRVTPSSPLAAGEFAIVLATGQMATFGYFGSGDSSSWFDFGVD